MLQAGLALRVGVIAMEANADRLDETRDVLRRLGVERIGGDKVRAFGRGGADDAGFIGDLCGSCAGNIVSIGPDGSVAPCNLPRRWAVGNVLERPLAEIANSPEMAALRGRIGDAVRDRRTAADEICDPKTCNPYSFCCPSTQSCNACAPNGCTPCYPKG